MDGSGRVFVSNTQLGQVERYDAAGNHQLTIGGLGSAAGEMQVPVGLTLDGSGRLHVAERGNNRVSVFDGDPDAGGVLVLGEGVGKPDRACDRITLDEVLLFVSRDLQLFAVGVDRGIARGCRLGMRCVFVRRALVLPGRLAEILVLEEKIRELVGDRQFESGTYGQARELMEEIVTKDEIDEGVAIMDQALEAADAFTG